MRLVLLGPPGAGKGTQARAVAVILGIPHVSTGDIFRAHVAGGTDLGREAKAYLDAGDLVPDAVTNAMVEERLRQPDAEAGFLLDGYPRTLEQADMLTRLLKDRGQSLTAVVDLVVDADELVRRVAGRQLAAGRSDDVQAVVRHRMDVYRRQTSPLVGYYSDQGLLRTVDGGGAVDDVTSRITDAVRAMD